jgi:hypothetical protein
MRHLFAGLLLFAFSSTVLAQTAVPYIFTPGTAAKASEINANFKALVTAINAGIPGYEIVSQTYTVPPQPSGSVAAPTYSSSCSAGKRVLGGGFSGQSLGAPGPNGGVPAAIALASQPGGVPGQPNGTQWDVIFLNNTTIDQTVVVTAICSTWIPSGL